MECKHKKAWTNEILLSHPPKYPWVCEICGLKGIQTWQQRYGGK